MYLYAGLAVQWLRSGTLKMPLISISNRSASDLPTSQSRTSAECSGITSTTYCKWFKRHLANSSRVNVETRLGNSSRTNVDFALVVIGNALVVNFSMDFCPLPLRVSCTRDHGHTRRSRTRARTQANFASYP